MNKKMASKLVDSLRQVRENRPARPDADGASTRAPSPRNTRFARQTDQSPPLSLDRPWDNLHPERIWPD